MRTALKGRSAVLVVVLALLGAVSVVGGAGPAQAAAPALGLVIDSEIGDPIGEGVHDELLPADGKVFVASSTATSFTFKVGSPACATADASCDYIVKLGPPTGTEWATGSDVVFEGAEKTATADAPMLDVAAGDTSCSAVTGRFIVDEIEFNDTVAPTVTKMVARFEQHCNGDESDPALFGMLAFNAESADPWFNRDVTPKEVDFEGVRIDESKELKVKLEKKSGDDLHPDDFAIVTNAPAGVFTLNDDQCTATPLSASCEVAITFTPQDDVGYAATLTWTDEQSPTGRDVPLTGQGRSSQLTVVPQPVLFGEARAGVFTEPIEVTLSNSGTDDVVIGTPSITGAHASSFAIDDGCNDTTLASGASCVIQVVAYPTAPFLRVATLNFDHDATEGPQSTPLRVTGTGGYYIAEIDGTVHEFGDAVHMGDMSEAGLNAPMLDITTTSDGDGYWMVGSDGGIFAFNAPFYGSTGGMRLNAPVLDMEAEVDDSGYWMVASDGGVFAFQAPYHGSMGGKPLNAPVVGIAAVPDGSGYWLVANDGGIFAFNAPFKGSMGGKPLNSPIVGMASTADGKGYWMVAEDGGVFAFNAPFFGSAGGEDLSAPVVAIEPTPTGQGYWLLQADGVIHFFGDAADYGDLFDLTDGQAVSLGMAGTAPPVNPAGAAGYFDES